MNGRVVTKVNTVKGLEAKRVFRGLPLGHPYPMRGAITPMATEGKMLERGKSKLLIEHT